MSNTNAKPAPCSVCQGTGAPGPNDQKCVCLGEGTAEAELKNLRAMAVALRATFEEVQVRLCMWGYKCSKPSDILPALDKLYERCTDAEDEYVRLKRQRVEREKP
jgi:hypothetical protein